MSLNRIVGGPNGGSTQHYVSSNSIVRQREADDLNANDIETTGVQVPTHLIAEREATLASGFLKGIVDPWNRQVPPPPSAYDPPSTVQQVRMNLTYKVPGPGGFVDSSRGLFMYFPKSGYDNFIHMGIVSAGATQANAINSGLNYLFQPNTEGIGGYTKPVLGTMTFNSELALPHADRGLVPSIQPSLPEEFSRVRLFSGGVECYGNTMSTGSIAFNGRLSAAIIADTRDIAQNLQTQQAYSATALDTAARNNKESLLETGLMEGCVQLVGDDVQPEFEPPNDHRLDTIEGSWASVDVGPLSSFQFGTNPAAITGVSVTFEAIAATWITPWNIEAGFGGSSFPTAVTAVSQGPTYNTAVDPIGEMDALDVHVNLRAKNVPPPAPAQPFPQLGVKTQLRVSCHHVYAYTDFALGNRINWRTTVETETIDFDYDTVHLHTMDRTFHAKPWLGYGNMSSGDYPQQDFVQYTNSVPAAGKYVGSFVIVSKAQSKSDDGFGAINYGDGIAECGLQVKVRAHEQSRIGHQGPAHIIRYDGVGQDQEIRVNGVANFEVVTKSNLSQYLKTASLDTRSPANNNIMNLVAALFKSSNHPYWRMTWNREQWLEWRNKLVNEETRKLVHRLVEQSPTSVSGLMEASGLFKTLGAGLGAVADDIFSASGNFCKYGSNPNSASGQFGSNMSTGQFGSF